VPKQLRRLWVAALAAVTLSFAQAALAGPLAELEALEQRLEGLHHERDELARQVQQLDRGLSRAEADLATTGARRAELADALAKQARALYRLRGPGRLALLLSAPSLRALHRRQGLLLHLVRRQRTLNDEAAHAQAELARARQDVLRVRAELAQASGLASAQAARLEVERAALREAVARLAADGVAAAHARRELGASGEALGEATSPSGTLPSGSARAGEDIARHRGRLLRPCAGRIRYNFGRTRVPGLKIALRQEGLEIDAPAGSAVHAVHAGRVALAGPLAGFGLVVVLAHGARYHSVYARLAGLEVRQGQVVARGDQVGQVGLGLLEGRPLLHFELRRDGAAVDPRPWLGRAR